MSEQNEKKWYVIRAISGKEKKVKEYLDAELSRNPALQDLISQVLIPTEKVYSVRNGKKVSKERNYLPGYVLIVQPSSDGYRTSGRYAEDRAEQGRQG